MSSKSIYLGDVRVPLANYATQANAILGIKGSGKTTTAKVIAEQMLEAEIPIIVLDPIGMWRYLKVPKEKGGKAYRVVVAGGQAGDLPLTPSTAPEIVRSAIKSNIPLIIDLYDMKLSKADWRRIVKSTCEILLFENKGVRHLFLEEAAEYVPQIIRDADVYAAVEKLCRMGGNASVGTTLINPRAQEVNKAVLELCELLILMRQKGSHAMAAIDKWLTMAQDVKNVAKTMASFGAGEAFVWPESSEPVRTQFPNCITFHPDRKKPDMPRGSIPENVTAFVDALRANLGNIEAELKANDPAELKRQVAEFKRKLEIAERNLANAKPSEPEKVPVLDSVTLKFLNAVQKECGDAMRQSATQTSILEAMHNDIVKIRVSAQESAAPRTTAPVLMKRGPLTPINSHALDSARYGATKGDDSISPVGQKILNAIAELESLSVERPVREMVALMAGYTNLTSTGYVKAVGLLRTGGYVDYPDSDTIGFTDSGRNAAHFPDRPRSSEEIQRRVCDLIGGKSAEILKPLIAAYPNALLRQDVAAAANYTNLTSTGFVKAVGRLRTLGFIDYPDSKTMTATPVLFLK